MANQLGLDLPNVRDDKSTDLLMHKAKDDLAYEPKEWNGKSNTDVAQTETGEGGKEKRETWGHKAEFILAIICLGIVWRFLCQKNGGGDPILASYQALSPPSFKQPSWKLLCRKGQDRCADAPPCISMGKSCDGHTDCINGEDEPFSCTTTNTNGSYMFTGNNGNQIPLEWMCDGEDDCSDASDETSCHFRNKGDRLSPHMKKDDSKFKEAPKKLDNPISPYIFFSHAYEIKSLRVAIVGDDDDCVYLEYVPIRVTDEDDDLVFERQLPFPTFTMVPRRYWIKSRMKRYGLLWVPTYNNYYSGRKQNRYSITESVYAVKSRHNDLLYLDSTCDPLSLGSCEDNVYWVHIIKFDGTRSDDLVLLKRLLCRPGIKVNGHHKALYRRIKWTNSAHLYLSFSLKSYEDNGYLWTNTDGARENVFVTVFCKTFGVKNPPGYEEKRGEIFYQRSGDERVDLNIPHPEKPKSEKDRGEVDKLWDPIASLGVISLLLVTIYRCSPGTKVTNITKCKVAKVKGQHGGVVIAGDYATVNFHYH